MGRSGLSLVVSLTITLSAISPAHAEPAAQPEPTAIERAVNGAMMGFPYYYNETFYYFDWCGPSKLGGIYRRAMLAWYEDCPFPEEARQSFARYAEQSTKRHHQELDAYIANNGELPEIVSVPGTNKKVTCREFQTSHEYVALRNTLERYVRGEVSNEAVMGPRCESVFGLRKEPETAK